MWIFSSEFNGGLALVAPVVKSLVFVLSLCSALWNIPVLFLIEWFLHLFSTIKIGAGELKARPRPRFSDQNTSVWFQERFEWSDYLTIPVHKKQKAL